MSKKTMEQLKDRYEDALDRYVRASGLSAIIRAGLDLEDAIVACLDAARAEGRAEWQDGIKPLVEQAKAEGRAEWATVQHAAEKQLVKQANETTGLLDEERRRWYASLERQFGLPTNTLEGLAPETAAEHLVEQILEITRRASDFYGYADYVLTPQKFGALIAAARAEERNGFAVVQADLRAQLAKAEAERDAAREQTLVEVQMAWHEWRQSLPIDRGFTHSDGLRFLAKLDALSAQKGQP